MIVQQQKKRTHTNIRRERNQYFLPARSYPRCSCRHRSPDFSTSGRQSATPVTYNRKKYNWIPKVWGNFVGLSKLNYFKVHFNLMSRNNYLPYIMVYHDLCNGYTVTLLVFLRDIHGLTIMRIEYLVEELQT